ncbi:MAG: PD-(D/E)XK nuclease family protein [Clostridia bacterium]|nr:PD-(D/E)XK nuclease family protein [Clostridia bacterium]
MITFLYGRSGTGKSYTVTKEIGVRLSQGEKVILLCPEQEAVIAEARLTEAFGGKIPTEHLEILNFGRLPERVFRESGGLTVQELGTGGRRLFMQKTLTQTAPLLKEYGMSSSDTAGSQGRGMCDGAMLDRLLAAVAECKMGCIKPSDLEHASAALAGGSYQKLHDKLSDLSLLYAAYERNLHKEYRDPEDMLTYLDEVLEDTNSQFFCGKTVYLDGFNGFTAQQYRIIRRIFDSAENVTISLGCDAGGAREWMFRRIYETEKTLFSILRELHKQAEIRSLHENMRTNSPALLYVGRHLWKFSDSDSTEVEDGTGVTARDAVRVFAADTPFSEAEAIALDIRRYIMAGGRYRDITVITRGIERYEGILDTIFEKYEIPFYMARRSELTSKPLFRYFTHLFSIIIYGTRRQDVIGLLKTGFSGIDEHDTFLYETYVTAWNLSGHTLCDGELWNMNPAGYREVLTEEDIAVLEAVNRVKRTLCDTLFVFCEDMRKKGETVAQRAARLYGWLRSAAIPEQLDLRAETERACGDIKDAEETEQLWDMFVGALDTLVTVSGEDTVDAETFFSLFELLVSDLDIGTIPARCDEVTAGDAALLRPDGAKRVYLIGAVDGAFPKAPEEDALLTDFDRTILAGLGVVLSAGCAEQMQDEMFHFWFAASAASETLTVTYPMADLQGKAYRPSIGAERILALFPDLVPQNPMEENIVQRVVNRETGLECLAAQRALCGNSAEPTSLLRALEDTLSVLAENDAAMQRKLTALTQPLVQRRCRLNEQTLALLFGNTVAMTQSRLESYVLCHFAYFCGYILKLREQKRVTFGTADIGSFVHYVLQKFMEQYVADAHPERFEDRGILEETVDGLIGQYMFSVCGMRDGARQTNRVRHLMRRLRQTAVTIIRNLLHEFAQSDFIPRDFELPVGKAAERDGGTGTGEDDMRAIPPFCITAEDGTRIRLYGNIDRVDTYEKDGTTYLRVVDYKTYVKQFSLDDVAAGVNMQMLLYLFSLWKNGEHRYGENLQPAGILYMAANPAEKIFDGIPTREEAEHAAEANMTRSGLFLDDLDVLRAMEHGLGGKYIPVKLKKDGTYYKGAPVETLEQFGVLMQEVEQTVCAIVREMTHGNADAVPISKTNPDTGRDPCSYCRMRAVCRG